MSKRVLISLVAVLLFITALTPVVLAAPLADTIVGENEVVNNDVVVFDGDLEVREGAVVNGDVAVFNGDAIIDGQINGSMTLFNGDLVAGSNAAISGECVLLNGEVTGDGATSRQSACTAISNMELAPLAGLAPGMFKNFENLPDLAPVPTVPAMPDMPAAPEPPVVPRMPDSRGGMVARSFGILAGSLLFGFLGLLTGAIIPNNLRQIVGTARDKTVVSGMAGALTAVAVPSLIILLIPVSIILTFVCIGLLGFPIMFLLGLGLVVGGFLGWIAVGTWLGVRLFGRGKSDRIVLSAALGTGLLTFITGIAGMLTAGIAGGVLTFFISCIGLGAVALTQFGMKPFPRRRQSNAPTGGATGDGLDPDKVDNVLGTLPADEIAI